MAVEHKDYYSILGVGKDADEKAIRRAYRKLAREYHPDVNQEDTAAGEKFKELTEAKEVLSDAEKRREYDELYTYYQYYGVWPGSIVQTAGPGNNTGMTPDPFRHHAWYEGEMGDIFGERSFFSGFFESFFRSDFFPQDSFQFGGRRRHVALGENVEAVIDVTLADAYQGATHTILVADPRGNRQPLQIEIPAGVDEGTYMRIAGQGRQGIAGRGDLYLYVHLIPHSSFIREGTTLYTRVAVPLPVAMRGGEIPVSLPSGQQLHLHIPPGTVNGSWFRLIGQGMPYVNQPGRRGDLYVEALMTSTAYPHVW